MVKRHIQRHQTHATQLSALGIRYLLFLGTSCSLLAASTTTSPNSPSFLPGFLLAYWICNRRKKKPIGGFLLWFYWQLYAGLLMTAVFVVSSIHGYVPENFDDKNQYLLSLASSVPGLLLFLIKCAVGTLLLSARTWEMLKLLRWVMIAELVVDCAGAAIDAVYFPDNNLSLTFMTIIPNALWLVYLFRSDRVRHVFQLHDWDAAVQVIHPQKLATA